MANINIKNNITDFIYGRGQCMHVRGMKRGIDENKLMLLIK